MNDPQQTKLLSDLTFRQWVSGLDWWWLCGMLLLLCGLVAASLLLSQKQTPIERALTWLLVALSFSPIVYACLVWSGAIGDDLLRFERQWAVPLCTACPIAILLRFSLSSDRSSPWRRQLRAGTFVASALCLGLCVAGVQLGQPLDRLAIVVAVDRSRSVELVANVETRVAKELQLAALGMREGDRLGVLAFGSTAEIETPLRRKQDQTAAHQVSIGRDATDLEQALRRSLLELPADARGKIVLLSDGVATRGQTANAVAAALGAEVPIDVVPLEQRPIQNTRLVNLTGPALVSEGETFELRAVIASPVEQQLEVSLYADNVLLRRGQVRVSAGQDVLNLRQRASKSGLRRYELRVSAASPSFDQLTEDNQRSTFVRVRGQANALVISSAPEDAVPLIAALEGAEIAVTSVGTGGLPANMAELTAYDLVVLRDVAAHLFTPEQLVVLTNYVRALGGGVLLMGSEQSMGPGGFGKTPLEDISPVSFDLKQDRRRGRLAEVIVIDYSGSMAASAGQHTKLELANEAAARSIELLSVGDKLGVMHVDTSVAWTLPLAELEDKPRLIETLRGVGPGGGGILVDLSLRAAFQALQREEANLKHVLLFADGADAEQRAEAPRLVRAALSRGVTTSVVALGQGSDVAALENLSRLGNGRFYLIEDARRLPAVFAQETITAARTAIEETTFIPQPRGAAGPLRGVSFEQAPALKGYIVTIPKQRAQVFLDGPERDPILASWSVGLGNVAAFTSDYTGRWGKHWIGWAEAAQLFGQLGRSLTRHDGESQVRLRAEARDGHIEVSADVIDPSARANPYRRLEVNVAGPSGSVQSMPLAAVGAGRYQGRMPLERPGAYLVSAFDASSEQLVGTAGAELHPADELKPTGTDRGALERIAQQSNGVVRDTLAGVFRERLTPRYSYRDISDILIWLGALFLLLSVAARRLSVPRWGVAYAQAISQLARSSKSPAASSVGARLHKQRASKAAEGQASPKTQSDSPDRTNWRSGLSTSWSSSGTTSTAPIPQIRSTPLGPRRPSARPTHAEQPPEGKPRTAAQVLLERRRKGR